MKRFAVALTVVGFFLATVGPARANELYFVSGAGEQFHGYTQPVLVIHAGDRVTYLNGDIAFHDVVAEEYGSDAGIWCTGFPVGQCPLFWSPLIGLGQTTRVLGIDKVPAGTSLHPFRCTIHPAMRGNLVVVKVM